jgi:hypothetical protein
MIKEEVILCSYKVHQIRERRGRDSFNTLSNIFHIQISSVIAILTVSERLEGLQHLNSRIIRIKNLTDKYYL